MVVVLSSYSIRGSLLVLFLIPWPNFRRRLSLVFAKKGLQIMSEFHIVSVPTSDGAEAAFRNLMRAGASSANPYAGELFGDEISIMFPVVS